MNRLRQLIHEIHRRSLWQVLAIYAVASWAVISGVGTLGDALGLPDWFPRLALGLLIVGLPVVLATAFVQEGGAPGEPIDSTDSDSGDVTDGGTRRVGSLFNWRNAFGGGVLAFALWGVVAAGWVLLGGGASEAGTAAATSSDVVTQRLFVMPLENLTDDPELDVLGRLTADQIAREIDHREPVPIVPSTTVSTAIQDLGQASSVEAVAARVQATHAFAGTVSRVGGQLRFEVELVDPRTDERLRSVAPVTGPDTAIDSLVAEVASRAATEATVVFNPAAPPWVGDMSSPVSATAYRAFLEQTSIFCTGDNAGSIPLGERAIRESPRFVAAIFQLMQAHLNLGHVEARDSLLEILDGLRDEMTRNEQLSLDWTISLVRRDFAAMERASEEAYRLDPAGRAGAAMISKFRNGRVSEAIERYEVLGLPGACPFPGYYRRAVRAYHVLGRFDDQLDVAREAAGVYPADRFYRESEATALVGLARLESVDSLVEVIVAMPGDDDSRLRPIGIAFELRAHGHRAASERLAQEILATDADDPLPLGSRHWFALWLVDRWDDALAVIRRREAQNPETFMTPSQLGDLGITLAHLGRAEEALAASARIDGVEDLDSERFYHQARIASALGDRDGTVRLLRRAFDAGLPFQPDAHASTDFEDLWGYGPFDALMLPR